MLAPVTERVTEEVPTFLVTLVTDGTKRGDLTSSAMFLRVHESAMIQRRLEEDVLGKDLMSRVEDEQRMFRLAEGNEVKVESDGRFVVKVTELSVALALSVRLSAPVVALMNFVSLSSAVPPITSRIEPVQAQTGDLALIKAEREEEVEPMSCEFAEVSVPSTVMSLPLVAPEVIVLGNVCDERMRV